jgi:NAD(P)-dependent dehydrogenase (short-subunit alcohol dehydrogenase family)
MNMRGLNGKRIVVAGGSTGIGAAVAVRLAEEGAKVIVGSTNMERLSATVGKITAVGGVAKAVQFDFADAESCQNLIEACVKTYGGVDGLANVGADLSHPSVSEGKDLLNSPEEHWLRQFDCNFMGYTRTVRAVLPHLLSQKNGSIVNTSSNSAHMGEKVRPAYAAAKASIHAMTRHVARRWGVDNVRCNAVSPGLVLVEKMKANVPPEMLKKMASGIPLGRGGEPSELAATYAFLLSDDAAWITGQVFSVNGGMLFRE